VWVFVAYAQGRDNPGGGWRTSDSQSDFVTVFCAISESTGLLPSAKPKSRALKQKLLVIRGMRLLHSPISVKPSGVKVGLPPEPAFRTAEPALAARPEGFGVGCGKSW
jgi:hypothetical protein